MNTAHGTSHNARPVGGHVLQSAPREGGHVLRSSKREGGHVLRSSKSEGGFTLLEMLMAMTILAIMGAALFTMFHTSTRTWLWADARTRQFVAGREALDLIVSEMRQAIVDPHANAPEFGGARFQGWDDEHTTGAYKEGENDEGEPYVYYDKVKFVAATEMHSSEAKQDLCVIAYWVQDTDPDDENPGELMRYCLDDTDEEQWSTLVPDSDLGGGSDVLGVQVRSLTFEYWSGEWDWEDGSTHRWTSSADLPQAVRIMLVVADPNEPTNTDKDKTFTTVVFMNTSE